MSLSGPMSQVFTQLQTGKSQGSSRFAAILSLCAAAIFALPAPVSASESYLTAWSSVYPGSATDDNANCLICHASDEANLNEYGNAVRQIEGSIEARIAAVEAFNSDGASGNNLAEINAGTQPGWTEGSGNVFYGRSSGTPGGTETAPGSISGDLDIPVVLSEFTLGGTVAGLTGSVSLNNGADILVLSTNSPFTFANTVTEGNGYVVVLSNQPAGQTCSLSNASGIALANVTNVAVTCVDDVVAGPAEVIAKLQEPREDSVYTGIGNLRGYAVSLDGVDRVELYIDGKFKGIIPYGGGRGDIGAAFPEIPNSSESGFSMAFNYNNLQVGEHTVLIRAFSNAGEFLDSSATFTVQKFHKSFFSKADAIDISGASFSRSGKKIVIQDVSIEGQLYDVRMQWNTQTQGFDIIEIR